MAEFVEVLVEEFQVQARMADVKEDLAMLYDADWVNLGSLNFHFQHAAAAKEQVHASAAAQAKQQAERGTAGLPEEIEAMELEFAAKQAQLALGAGALRQSEEQALAHGGRAARAGAARA